MPVVAVMLNVSAAGHRISEEEVKLQTTSLVTVKVPDRIIHIIFSKSMASHAVGSGQHIFSANFCNDKPLYANNFLLHNPNIHLQYKFEKNVSQAYP